MKCNHCLVEFHPAAESMLLGRDADGEWAVEKLQCPRCNKFNLFLLRGQVGLVANVGRKMINVFNRMSIRPKGSNRPPAPSEVPEEIASDYQESCLVLSDSPKASAALSRRCLQNILRSQAKVTPGDLASEIEQVLKSGTLPSHIGESIDAVRNTGNFAAHPMKSKSTGEIVPVELGEAEWNLDVLELLFDFYFVQPAKIKKKRADLDAKLKDAGKPPMK